jgi:CCR4-NOT transcription complex subunit 9
MLQTSHLFSHQQQYGQHEQSPWQHDTRSQNHQSMNQQGHANSHQQQQYNRIAVNHNHSNNHNRSSENRQSSTDQPNGSAAATSMSDAGAFGMDQGRTEEDRKVLQWVAELLDPARREGALMELSKKREQVPELALVLWHSFGVMTSLMQEIISVYPLLNPSQLTAAASNRVCNALALLQCVASHNETRGLFLSGESMFRCDEGAFVLITRQHIFRSSSIRFSTRLQSLGRSSISA